MIISLIYEEKRSLKACMERYFVPGFINLFKGNK